MLGDGKDEGITAFVEPFVILTILFLNASIGVWQETNADKAIEALKDLQAVESKCLREGKWQTIDATHLVPGDIVEVKMGDKVPADIRVALMKSVRLQIEEAALTGESRPVEKKKDTLPASTSNILQE